MSAGFKFFPTKSDKNKQPAAPRGAPQRCWGADLKDNKNIFIVFDLAANEALSSVRYQGIKLVSFIGYVSARIFKEKVAWNLALCLRPRGHESLNYLSDSCNHP